MQIILALLVGNLGALLVHGLTWQMRKKCLCLLVVLGVLCIPVFLGITVLLFTPPIFSRDSSTVDLPTNWVGVVQTFGAVLFLSSLCGAIQMRQIPTRWWKAFLSLWGEILISPVVLLLVFLVGNKFGPRKWIDADVCGIVFPSVLIFLAFMRPFVVRWVHPVWQLMLNPGKPITENHD